MADENSMNKTQLLAAMQKGWNDLEAYIKTLTESQITTPTDAAGWTVKDHLIHLAPWASGVEALLRGKSRTDAMGLDKETWDSGDYDKMNAIIQQRYKDMPLDEVIKTLRETHQKLVDNVQTMSDEDLQRPYHTYQPDSDQDKPVINWIIGNSFEHYGEHIPWMSAIVAGK